jgi:hypothetical protein
MELQLTKEHVTKYINSKGGSWSPSAIKSEHARLRVALSLINLGAKGLFEEGSKKYAPYTLKTLFIRAGELWEHHFPEAPNQFKVYLKEQALQFKNAYQRQQVGLTFEEAVKRIASIERLEVRKLAAFMLHSGLRSEEALKYDGTSGFVIGKGGRPRPVLTKMPYPVGHKLTHSILHKELAKVGIKPHDLRKLCATRLVDGGFREADLLRVMGWTNMQTAAIYVQPMMDQQLSARMQEVLNGSKLQSA